MEVRDQPQQEQPPPPVTPAPTANSAIQDKVNLEILKTLKELKEMAQTKKRGRDNC